MIMQPKSNRKEKETILHYSSYQDYQNFNLKVSKHSMNKKVINIEIWWFDHT